MYSKSPTWAELATKLISRGAVLNTPGDDYVGNTPLHEAVKNDNETILKVLLSAGAKVNIKNVFGSTPVHLLARSTICTDLAIEMMNCEADVNAQDNPKIPHYTRLS